MANDNELIKYPRTPHLPFSLGRTSDDKIASKETMDNLRSGMELTVSSKMDGGNVTMTRLHFFARSLDSGTHSWDAQAKGMWANIRWGIPVGWRISGESLHARRSVGYDDLPDVYLVFGVWNEDNVLLGWDESEAFAGEIGLHTVPVLYRGSDYNEAVSAWEKTLNPDVSEGFVIRNAGRIPYDDFGLNVAKYVRANHVQTASNWRNRDDWVANGFARK